MRKQYTEEIDSLIDKLETAPVGDVNFVVSSIIWGLWRRNPCYDVGNKLIGALECVKLEFYRRMVVPYEVNKEVENGDLDSK